MDLVEEYLDVVAAVALVAVDVDVDETEEESLLLLVNIPEKNDQHQRQIGVQRRNIPIAVMYRLGNLE